MFVTTTTSSDSAPNNAFIPDQVIVGICTVTVQGRDLEDALAPIYIVEEIIHAYVGQHDWQMPTWPDWLGGPDVTEPSWTDEQRKSFIKEFAITPIVVALASTDYLGGGDTDRVTLEADNAGPFESHQTDSLGLQLTASLL